MWKLGKWKTKELKAFLDDYNPDVLFFPLGSEVYMTRLHRYIAKYTGKPVVSYLIDDTVSFIDFKGSLLSKIRRVFYTRNNKYLLKNSKKVFTMVPKAQKELKDLFGVESTVLTKSVDFSGISFKEAVPVGPLKMIYTGALSIGREEELCRIAEAVAKINSETERLSFEVYSADNPREESLKVLNNGGCRFCGSVSREKSKEQREWKKRF